MTEAPYFSLITLTFNSSNTIGKTLDSIKAQTFKNFEIIFQDAASNDSTVALIGSQIDKFGKATLVSEPDEGIYDGLNKAIERAKGKFVCVLHADDVFSSKDTLKTVALKLETENYNLAYGDVVFTSSKKAKRIVRRWKAGEYNRIRFWLGWMPPHTSLFIQRELLNSSEPYRTDLSVSADYDLILKLFKSKNIRPLYLKQTITKMSIGGQSTSGFSSLFLVLKEDSLVLWRHFGLLFFVPLVLKRVLKIPQYIIFSKN